MLNSTELKKAKDRLACFSFSSTRPNVHVLSPVVDAAPVPAPKQRKAGFVQKAA
jgi:hypothetical protein